MNDEQFEKDRRNRWAQTRVIVDEIAKLRRTVVALVILNVVLLFSFFGGLIGYIIATGGG